jgi:hypothetical protein
VETRSLQVAEASALPERGSTVVSTKNAIRSLFVVAALYDGILGLAFLFRPDAVFTVFAVTPPNHFGYVQFPAALLLVFALMFAAIARDAEANRNLIPFGILLKISYCGVVFAYWFTTGIPAMWKPFAVADVIFVVLFGGAYASLPSRKREVSDHRATT